MDPVAVTQSPFGVLTFIAAPALLTNATSVLALSTTTRMLRTRDAMSELLARSQSHDFQGREVAAMVEHVNRVESQAELMLTALHSIYLALGAFSGATLVTLIGAALAPFQGALWYYALAFLGLGLGSIGVGCLIFGSIRLFQATRLSLLNIREDAGLIRTRYKS